MALPPTPTQLLNGGFQNAAGNALSGGYLTLQLSAPGTIASVGSITTGVVTILLDDDGNVVTSPPQYIWANANISPVTFYKVTAYTAQGQACFGPNNQVVGAGSTFNLSTWVPNQTSGTPQSGTLVNVAGTQGAPSLTQLLEGNFQDAEGNLLSGGYLEMKLNVDGFVSDAGICSGVTLKILLDDDGNVITSPAQYALANSTISPANTFYRVTGFTAQGQVAWGPNSQTIGAGSTFNLGTWTPNLVILGDPSTSDVTPVGFQDPSGNPLALGKLKVQLLEDASFNDAQICAGSTVEFSLDSNGNIVSGSSLWQPAIYNFTAYSKTGQPVWNGQVSVVAPVYTLTLLVDPSNSGTASASPEFSGGNPDGSYSPGTVVGLTSTPDGGFIFNGWTGAVASTSENPTSITMNASETVVADNLAVASFLIRSEPSQTIRYTTPGGIINTLAVPAFLDISSIALDGNGNIYVADEGVATVFKITPGLVVTPFVGAGSSTIPATFSTLAQIAVDAAGNLYICDSGAHKIFAVNTQSTSQTLLGVTIASNAIALVAGGNGGGNTGDGGSALSAKIVCFAGICLSAAGLYFSTSNSYYSVRFVSQSGVISTVAGNGTPEYSGSYPPEGDGGPALSALCYLPSSIACDAAGNLYINDQAYASVRAVNMQASTQTLFGVSIPPGYIDIVAGLGNEQQGYTGDGGPALDATLDIPIWLSFSGPNLTIYQNGAPAVRQVNASTLVINTVIGTGVNGFSGDNGPATSARIQNCLAPVAFIGG